MGLKRAILGLLPTSTNRLRRDARRFAEQVLGPSRISQIEGVPGCLNREQGSVLCYLVAATDVSGCVVEIGSFMGLSTLWLAEGVRHGGKVRVVAIDPHDGHERPEIEPQRDSYATFLDHLRQADVEDVVEPIRERSASVAKRWDEPIRLLWVDGSHDYGDVLADLEGFAPHVSPGGYVALHDTRGGRFPGVRQAMLEYFAGHREFARVVNLRNMTVYQRRAGEGAASSTP
ncbi:MAG: class I SAM-dependent methyltransferase [Phycisphaerae bacterium]|nr:class I SAM-dependent methyltransferase [Phycisphaerae bacterium]